MTAETATATVEETFDDPITETTTESVVEQETKAIATTPSIIEPSEFAAEAKRWADANPALFAEFVKSKMGYAGGAFSYTCEKALKEAGVVVQRGERSLGAFAVLAKAAVEKSERLSKIKIAAKWWDGREIVAA